MRAPSRIPTVLVILSAFGGAVMAAACGGKQEPAKANRASLHGASPFRVMVVTGINTQINNQPTLPDAARVAADVINRHGGLGGRPLEVTGCNMLGTAAGQAACARKAVAERFDDVVQSACCSNQSNPILDAGRIPQIGTFANTPVDFKDPNIVPVFGGSPLGFACIPLLARRHGVDRLAAEVLDVEVSWALADVVKLSAGRLGVDYVGSVGVPVDETDFSAYVRRLAEMKPDGVAMIMTPPSGFGTFKAMRQQGLGTMNFEITNSWGDDEIRPMGSFANGLRACSSVPPQSATQIPAIRRMHAEFNAAGVSNKGPGNIQIWLTMYALKALADRVEGPVTGRSLLAAARRETNIDVIGLFPWSPAHAGPAGFRNLSNGNAWFVVDRGGRWVLEQNQPTDVWRAIGLVRK
jgi:ABC-type branched-subunit amino acid transport system substrate-binding protein